jgi:predicted ArsR family transcriptional regulator
MWLIVVSMPREFRDEGGFKTMTTLDDVLDAFETVGEPVVTTGEIAEAAGCSREGARQKLTTLYEDDRIERKRSGQSLVWWRVPPEESEERPDRRLRRLSRELDEAIVVGDLVYEDGDTHQLPAEDNEKANRDE